MKKILFILILLASNFAFSQDICDNGIDDDGDGLIDLQDTTDCSCEISISSGGTVTSLIANPSFENRTCCPSSLGQLNCANTWQQASSATSDYFNTCGRTSLFTAPPNPLPNGNGYVGFYNGSGATGGSYKEYIGACLLDTMFAGTSYQIQFSMAQASGNMNAHIAIYGSNSCGNLPFGGTNSQFGCPANGPGWDAMDSTIITLSATSWTLVTLSFTPTQNITAIVLGGNCGQVNSRNYYYVDNLLLNTTASFNPSAVNISDTGYYCRGDLVLKADYDTLPNSFQWYKDSIALVGETDSVYNVLPGGIGNYQVRLMYDSGCIITPVYSVDTAVINFDLDSTGTCSAGVQVGQIDVLNARGGVGAYEYQLDVNSFVLDSVFDFLSPAVYNITVMDVNKCKASKNVTVNSYTSPQTFFYADTACLGNLTTFTDTSTGPITNVLWVFGDGTTSVQNTGTVQHQYANSGIYMVKLVTTTTQGCIDSLSIQVEVRDMPIADFTFSNSCQYNLVQFTNATTIGGGTNTSGLLWDWDFGNATVSNLKDPTSIYPSTGVFNVTLSVSSPGGCIADTTKQIEIFYKPLANYGATTVCLGEITQFTDLSSVVSGSIVSWDYTIENIGYTVQNPMHQYSTDGTFGDTLIVTTNNGCKDTLSSIAIVNPLPVAEFNFTPEILSLFQTQTCFNNLSQNEISYMWDFGFPGGVSVNENPCVEFPKEIANFYTVSLAVDNQYGCIDTVFKTIEVQEEFLFYLPSAFSPDGDGVNDVFMPIYSGVIEIEFYVFDRWGTKIFYSDQLHKGWDGTYKSTKIVQQDVYIYRVIATDLNLKSRVYTGHVNLLK
jgi:gliding motility-associated-like protein